MLRLLAFLLFLSVSSKQCPKWTCSKYVPDNLCYKLDKKNNYVHVQDSNTQGCVIEPFLRDPEKYEEQSYTMVNKTENDAFEVLKRQYCEGVDFYNDVFNCTNFKHSPWYVTKTEKKWDEYFSNFQNNFTEEGKQEWETCDEDKECRSGKCECVPSIQGQARCTSSVWDSWYTWKQIFREVCQKQSFSDTACKNWLYIKFGHHLEAFQDNEKQKNLTCLNNFTDVSFLYEESGWGFWDDLWQVIKWPLIIIGIICCCFCCCICCGAIAKAAEDEKQKLATGEDYQKLGDAGQNTELIEIKQS